MISLNQNVYWKASFIYFYEYNRYKSCIDFLDAVRIFYFSEFILFLPLCLSYYKNKSKHISRLITLRPLNGKYKWTNDLHWQLSINDGSK